MPTPTPRRPVWFWAATALAALLLAAVLADAYFSDPPTDADAGTPAAEVAEDPAAREALLRRAFAGAAPGVKSPEALAFLDALGRSARAGDAAGAMDSFRAERLLAEVRRRTGRGADPRGDAQDAAAKLYQSFGRVVATQFVGVGFDRVEALLEVVAPGGRERVLWCRHSRASPEAVTPVRWWLCDDADRLAAYDFEDCRTGVRLSELLAAASEVEGDGGARVLGALGRASDESPPTPAELAALRALALPPALHALLALSEAAGRLGRGELALASECLDLAERVRPGMPALDLMRAVLLARQGKIGEAMAAAGRYEARLGPEPRTLAVRGLAGR